MTSPSSQSQCYLTLLIRRPSKFSRLIRRLQGRKLLAASQLKLAKAIANGVEEFMRSNPPPATWLAQRREEIRYTIGRGDTISEIAQRYGVTSAALKKRNRLSSDSIRVGQTIVIPRG